MNTWSHPVSQSSVRRFELGIKNTAFQSDHTQGNQYHVEGVDRANGRYECCTRHTQDAPTDYRV